MAEQLTPVAVGVKADTGDFTKGLQEVTRTVDTAAGKVNASLSRMSKGFQQTGSFASGFANELGGNTLSKLQMLAKGGAAAGAALGLTAIGIAGLARHSVKVADDLGDMAANLGITTDALQELNYVAMLGGVSQEGFAAALNKLNLNLGQAKDGGGSLVEFFKDYNRTTLASLQHTSDASVAFGILADAVAKETDATKRRQIATAAFGKGELSLINTLLQGADAIDEQRKKAHELGLVIENSLIVNAGHANDQLDTLGRVIMTKLTAEAVKLAPALDRIATSLINGLPVLINWVNKLGELFGLIDKAPDGRLKDVNAEISRLNSLLTKNETLQKTLSLGGLLGNFDHDDMAKRLEALRKERDNIIGKMQASAAAPKSKPAGGTSTRGSGIAYVKTEADAAAKALQKANDQRDKLVGDIDAEYGGLVRLATAQEISIMGYEKMTQTLEDEKKVRAAGIDVMSAEGQALLQNMERNRALQDEIDRTKAAMQRLSSFSTQMGDRISDAFGDAIMSGQSLRETLSSLLNDISRMIYKSTVGQGISNAISGALFSGLGSLFGGGGTGAISPYDAAASGIGTTGAMTSAFGFANGGIMGGKGPMPLRTYSSGGVANSPQMAIYGEGRKPEAYVPLPDGRTIPVTMSGGGGDNMTFNFDFRGAAAGVEDMVKQMVPVAVGQALKQYDDAKRRNPTGLR